MNKIANTAKLTGTGAVIGGSSGTLKEAGVNPLAADLASGFFAPGLATRLKPTNLLNSFKQILETAARVPLKLMGLSPKGLNVEATSCKRFRNRFTCRCSY